MKRIYLAEDAAVQAKLYRRALTRIPDVEVLNFDDGLEVYTRSMLSPPDLLVLDIMIPTLSGGAALRLLKFDRTRRSIPVLVLSAMTEEGMEEKLRRMGADSFLAKPVRPDVLINEACRLLDVDVPPPNPATESGMWVLPPRPRTT